MNEEEAIKILKNAIKPVDIEHLSFYEIYKDYVPLPELHRAIEVLLDLYQQEKEKNQELKVLIEQNLKYSHNLEKDLFENCSNYVVSKAKIREKIKEYDGLKEMDMQAYEEQIKPLKELLEEE